MIVTENTADKLVLQCQYFKNRLETGAPNASVGCANPTGWSDERISFAYLKHYISYKRRCKEDQVLSNNYQRNKKKMALSCLHCHPIHHISYSHWTAPPLVHVRDIIGSAVNGVNILQCLP
jgi:hypothetical protein